MQRNKKYNMCHSKEKFSVLYVFEVSCFFVFSMNTNTFPDLHHRFQRPPPGLPQPDHEPPERGRAAAQHG